MKSKKLLGLALIATALLSTQPAFAKGAAKTVTTSTGTQVTLPALTTSTGPCALDNATNATIYYTPTTREIDVELLHNDLPGGASARVVRDLNTNLLYISNVCLEEGWTVSQYKMAGAWGKDQGVDLTVAYNGVDAVRYRMLGEGIRFDYY